MHWEALGVFQDLVGTITNNIKDSFEFIEIWIHIACMKAMGMENSVVKTKWKNPHADRKFLRWML